MNGDRIPVAPFLPTILERAGLRFDHLMRRIGAPMFPGEHRQSLSTAQFFALWDAVEASSVPADFGLRLPAAVPPHLFDVASTAALMSENLGDALARLARYKRLTCPEDIEVAVTGREARVCFVWLRAGSLPPALIVDASFAWLCQLAAMGSGGHVKPRRIELARSKRGGNLLKTHFGCPIRFNASRDLVVFPEAALSVPFTSHHPDMLDMLTPGLDAALKTHVAVASLTGHVREVLLKVMQGRRPSVEQVASELSISTRTLQRRLEEEGTSYQRLLDEVRQETARHLLSSTDLDPGEIAYVLGYEELNSFSRAFRSWEGTTPSRWRLNSGRDGSRTVLQR